MAAMACQQRHGHAVDGAGRDAIGGLDLRAEEAGAADELGRDGRRDVQAIRDATLVSGTRITKCGHRLITR